MEAKLRRIEVDEGEPVGIPNRWVPVRLEHNDYATPDGKTFTLYVLGRA